MNEPNNPDAGDELEYVPDAGVAGDAAETPKAEDPYGDRKWMDAKRGEAASDRRAAVAASAAAGRDGALEELKSEIMDLDRVDVDALVQGEAKRARKETGLAWEPDALGLPPFCPVAPLGKKGGVFYFLTPDHELMQLAAGNFGQSHIDALFAPQTDYLVAMWGAPSKTNKTRVQYELLRRNLMDACATKGLFDPGDRVRGRGAWKGESGGLIVHYGDQVVIDGEALPPGAYGNHVYTAGPKLPPPLGDGGEEARAAARSLLNAFACWRWARGALDAKMLLGWIVASLMGAAADWRPQVMLTGDSGTGKSTLQHLLKSALGDRLLDVADASAAGLYQTLGYDSLGVAFDEFENEDEQKGAAVMRLARLASSGARLVRGGADGVPSNYLARGAFLFSAINPPAMRPAEQNRTTILALRELRPGDRPPLVSAGEAAKIGAHLAARIIRMWTFWPERLDFWRGKLAAMKHSSRGQDQFGTLLAAADLALSDLDPSTDEAAEIEEILAPSAMIETAGAAPNWRRCLNHALGYQPDPWRSYKYKQVGHALMDYAKRADNAWSLTDLRNNLALAGLALVQTDAPDLARVTWLGFPARNPALARVFEATDWSARRGADGSWINALAQCPEGQWQRGRFRCGGARDYGVLVRLDLVLDVEEEKCDDGQEKDDL